MADAAIAGTVQQFRFDPAIIAEPKRLSDRNLEIFIWDRQLSCQAVCLSFPLSALGCPIFCLEASQLGWILASDLQRE